METNLEKSAQPPPSGWITHYVEKIIRAGTWISIKIIGSQFLAENIDKDKALDISNKRAKIVDTFIFICFLADFILIFILHLNLEYLRFFIIPVLAWRIIDVICSAVRVTIFDEGSHISQKTVSSSRERVVVLGFLNFIEIGICFGGIYSAFPDLIKSDSKDILQAFHLSFVTQTTIGYGDVFPLAWLRIVTWFQGLSGLVIIALLLGRYIGLLPNRKSS